MLRKRIITAALLVPILIGVFFYLSLDSFAVAILIAIYLMAKEWSKFCGLNGVVQQYFYVFVVIGICLAEWYLFRNLLMWPSPSWPSEVVWDVPMLALTLGGGTIMFATFIVFTYSTIPKWWANGLVIALIGVLLLPAFFVTMVSIRNTSYVADFYRGGELLLLMFCMIWGADTGAYFVGKTFGQRKMAPNVSPNKTWEGFWGGVILSVVVAILGGNFIQLDIDNNYIYAIVALALAILSVVGDLFESALKRVSNIKDSGKLLPGHGGLLDRLDSTLVVAPLYFLSFSYFGWF